MVDVGPYVGSAVGNAESTAFNFLLPLSAALTNFQFGGKKCRQDDCSERFSPIHDPFTRGTTNQIQTKIKCKKFVFWFWIILMIQSSLTAGFIHKPRETNVPSSSCAQKNEKNKQPCSNTFRTKNRLLALGAYATPFSISLSGGSRSREGWRV